MSEYITLSKRALASLLDGIAFPNPDDSGPYGPLGPVIRDVLRSLSWAFLNPQPLPPRSGPLPDPGRSGLIARWVIDQTLAQFQLADVVTGAERSERTREVFQRNILQFVEEMCGTRPPRAPLPWPWPPKFDFESVNSITLLVAGAHFQKATDLMDDHPLQESFSAAADQLFATGVKRLEGLAERA